MAFTFSGRLPGIFKTKPLFHSLSSFASKYHFSAQQKVVVCGAGNAAHVFTALAASNPNNDVHLISLFQDEAARFKAAYDATEDKAITVQFTQEKRELKASPSSISNDASKLAGADTVILSLPAFAHNEYLQAVKDHVTPKPDKKTLVACFPGASGLECEWQSIFGVNEPGFVLLSCITLPWAARALQFGQTAEVLGTKHQIEVCIKSAEGSNKNSEYIDRISDLIGIPPKIVDYGHILNMSLSAINAIVHPSIMFGKWRSWDGKAMQEKPLFYQGIDEASANLMSQLSDEALHITRCIEKETGLTLKTQHIAEWYFSCYGADCTDSSSLKGLIMTNPGYNGLVHPMKGENGQWVPNFQYRYLSEDIPMGLAVMRGLSLILKEVPKVPLMDDIIQWSQQLLGKQYLEYKSDGSIVAGKDVGLSRAPQRYGITSIQELV